MSVNFWKIFKKFWELKKYFGAPNCKKKKSVREDFRKMIKKCLGRLLSKNNNLNSSPSGVDSIFESRSGGGSESI